MWKPPKRNSNQNRHHNNARRAARHGSEVARFKYTDIAERDGWRCGICHRQVSPDKKWPDLKSGSIDHIIPISEGGPHTSLNVRLAHLGCNSKRGAKGAVQLRLIA